MGQQRSATEECMVMTTNTRACTLVELRNCI